MNDEWIINLSNNVNLQVRKIVEVWDDIGIIGDKFRTRSDKLSDHINQLLNELLAEENNNRNILKLSVENLKKDIILLCNLLKMEVKIPSEDTLVKNEHELMLLYDKLMETKSDRIDRYSILLNMEKELCERLFEIRQEFNSNLIPTENQLNVLDKHIKNLQFKKTARQESFLNKRLRILDYFKLLEKTAPDEVFIETILKDTFADNVPLSEDFLNQCDIYIDQISSEYEKNKEECIKLRSRYEILCNILFPNEIRNNGDNYISKNSNDFRIKTLEKLRNEVSLLEKSRLDKMEEFVKTYQNKIKEKMNANLLSHFKDVEPYKSLLNSEIYDETLLEKLEHELDKFIEIEKQIYPIQNEINNWNTSFSKLAKIKLQLKDANVLKNRGGILLKVEKEKKVVNKELPKSESKIKSLLLTFESDLIVSDDLMIDNMKVLDYLLYQWNHIDNDKENEKKVLSKNELSKSTSAKVAGPKKAPLSKINESVMSNSSQSKLSNPSIKSPNPIPQKLSFKIPQLKKMPKKQHPISPIQEITKKVPTGMNKRFSRSCMALNSPKVLKNTLNTSSSNLYGMFCKDIQPGIKTSSFIEYNQNRRY